MKNKRVSWENLESKLRSMKPEELKEDILDKVNFVLSNFGQPDDYYNHSNPKCDKINEAIEDLMFMYYNIFTEDNEDIVKNLYHHCSSKKRLGGDYTRFYLELNRCFNVWYYGETNRFEEGTFGDYTILKHRMIGLTRLMEEGKIPDMIKRVSEYRKDSGGRFSPQYN